MHYSKSGGGEAVITVAKETRVGLDSDSFLDAASYRLSCLGLRVQQIRSPCRFMIQMVLYGNRQKIYLNFFLVPGSSYLWLGSRSWSNRSRPTAFVSFVACRWWAKGRRIVNVRALQVVKAMLSYVKRAMG